MITVEPMANGTPPTITVYLGLGSNVGDRQANLREAIACLERLGLEIVCESSIYETEPVGYKDQPWFLNQVIKVRANPNLSFKDDLDVQLLEAIMEKGPELAAGLWMRELLKELLDIEHAMGREHAIPEGPRVIDIDILLCGNIDGIFAETSDVEVAKAESLFLILPHPRIHLRRFVLEPLCEIAPDVVHPTLKKTCRELLSALDDPSTVRLYRRAER